MPVSDQRGMGGWLYGAAGAVGRLLMYRDGRIVISVRTKEGFASRIISERAARRFEMGTAMQFGVRTGEYCPRALDLADQVGRPTGEGCVLLEFLRHGGKLGRCGDDMDLLCFEKCVREWMGIDGDPFQFSRSRTLWSGLFECSSFRSLDVSTTTTMVGLEIQGLGVRDASE